MSKGSKKAKKKIKAPPLSFVDKVAYMVLLILAIVICSMPYVVYTIIQRSIVMASSDVIAYRETAAELWLLLPLLPAIIILITLISVGYEYRKPIFGKKYNHPTKPKNKWYKSRYGIVTITSLVLIWSLLWLPAIGGIFSRTEITETEVRKYASFGRQTEQISLSEASSVSVQIYWRSNGIYSVTGDWTISYTIRFENGAQYTFSKVTDTMIKIDNLFQGVPKKVDSVENFDEYCEEHNCTHEQREAIKKMFMIK